ncbi:MAG: saccharopine dehydrogenase NADP-binding domain-containing protein [Polyangiales bacterium]
MQSSRTYDIVLFGATGFTGALTAQYLASTAGELRWALAGRNREKLEAVRNRLSYGGAERPDIVAADVTDRASLDALAQSARVVITTVGPYIRYGEPLVAACAQAGTDYVDLTGEPQFVEQMTSRYHAQAVATGAKIVNACGFDSIPHDLGVLFTIAALEKRLPGGSLAKTPVTIEGFVRMKGGMSGGTWQSMLLILSELPVFSSKFESTMPGRQVKQLSNRIGYRSELGFWAVPAPTIDPEVVCRSATLLERYGSDFRYGHYIGLRHLPQVAGFVAGAGALFAASKSRLARDWLVKLRPSGAGPSDAERRRSFFRVVFLGRAGDQRVRCEVRGGDPGYGETAKMLAESALCLALDRARLPEQCGVIPSAAAFGDVLIERLSRAGIAFEEQALPSEDGDAAYA